jgi:hypothetical protein
MKQLGQPRKPNRIATLLLITAIALGAAACSAPTATPTAPAATAPAATLAPTAAAPVATDAPALTLMTLSEVDRALSLEGYGAQGALLDLDMSVADMLSYAIQDEYIAHGEYAAIIAEFGAVSPYSNIIKSEESHISFLVGLFDTYGMDVPADDSASRLVIPADLLEAAKTGVQAEIGNIAMYEQFLGEALPLDVLGVFTSLKTASESHLAAFEKQVARLS